MIDHKNQVDSYVAWTQHDLEACPLHKFLKTRKERHILVCADGQAKIVTAAELSGIDWQRVLAIGPVTAVVSALLSFGNVPARIKLTLADA